MLDICLDSGLSELDFWNMTVGEVIRYLQSYERRRTNEMREKAMFVYRLADLIGVSCGRYYTKEFVYPEIYEVFSGLYTEEEVETARQEERDRKMIEKLKQMAGVK